MVQCFMFGICPRCQYTAVLCGMSMYLTVDDIDNIFFNLWPC